MACRPGSQHNQLLAFLDLTCGVVDAFWVQGLNAYWQGMKHSTISHSPRHFSSGYMLHDTMCCNVSKQPKQPWVCQSQLQNMLDTSDSHMWPECRAPQSCYASCCGEKNASINACGWNGPPLRRTLVCLTSTSSLYTLSIHLFLSLSLCPPFAQHL